MNLSQIRQILKDTDYVRTGGSPEELRTAEYLMEKCRALGAEAHLESFKVQMARMKEARLSVDGVEIPCRGYFNCGSGTAEGELCYLPNTDAASLWQARGKIVLLDTGIGYFTYKDLLEQGVAGIITYNGNVNFRDSDIDQKELRDYVHEGKKTLAVNINVKDAVKLVKAGGRRAHIVIDEEEYEGESRNVVAALPGRTEETIVLSAHYDSTFLSHGAYDNMTGSIGLLGILEAMARTAPNRYGLVFLFAGSEERGLLGSKAYVRDHESELSRVALNINLDMIGSLMGRFLACCTAEEKLVHYVNYICSEIGFGMDAYQGVYSSDSTPFADRGVPALSFARIASNTIAPIHNRYDTMAVVSPARLKEDIDFLAYFTDRMANAVKCPVGREIPENMKTKLDEYLNRRRPEKHT